MSDNTLATGETATDAPDLSQTENQAEAIETRTYTQQEVDDMMARMRGSITKKALKPYEDLGDPEELRQLKAESEKRRQDNQLKRGEFEKTLQEIVAKKDSEIAKRDAMIKEYKVDMPLTSAAARYRAINAEQVKSLLKNNLRLNDEGDVEVIDTQGSVRYQDNGNPYGVDELVREFLDSNPHFVSPTPATTNSRSSLSAQAKNILDLDVSKLNMSNPEDRARYKEYRKAKGY